MCKVGVLMQGTLACYLTSHCDGEHYNSMLQ